MASGMWPEVAAAASSKREDNMRIARTNALRMSVIIISAFIICWTPYAVLIVVEQIFEEMVYSWPPYILDILFIFAFSSSLINPFIHSGRFFGCDYLAHVPGSRANMMSTTTTTGHGQVSTRRRMDLGTGINTMDLAIVRNKNTRSSLQTTIDDLDNGSENVVDETAV